MDARVKKLKQGLSQLAGQAASSVGGWVAKKIGYSQDEIDINAQEMTASNAHQDNEFVYEQKTFGDSQNSQNSQYLPHNSDGLTTIPGIGYQISRKNRKSVRKSVRKVAKRSVRKSSRKSVRKVAKRSVRKSVRKVAKRSVRKSVRKVAKRSVRKSVRKVAKK